MKDMTNLDEFEVGYDIPAKPGMDEADIQTPSLVPMCLLSSPRAQGRTDLKRVRILFSTATCDATFSSHWRTSRSLLKRNIWRDTC